MVRKEVAAISNNRGDSSTDRFHIMQWIITPDPVTPVFQGGIEAISVRYAYDALFWAGAGNMAPKSFPTVMLLDYFGVMIPGRHDLTAGDIYEARTLAIGLNLYMVSENCDTGVIKHPLKNPKTNTKMARGVLVNDTLRVDEDLFKRLEIGPVPLTIAEAKRRKRSAAVGRFARPKP